MTEPRDFLTIFQQTVATRGGGVFQTVTDSKVLNIPLGHRSYRAGDSTVFTVGEERFPLIVRFNYYLPFKSHTAFVVSE